MKNKAIKVGVSILVISLLFTSTVLAQEKRTDVFLEEIEQNAETAPAELPYMGEPNADSNTEDSTLSAEESNEETTEDIIVEEPEETPKDTEEPFLAPVYPVVRRDGDYAVLDWAQLSGAEGYILYRRMAGDSTWEELKTLTSCTYTDKAVKAGNSYEYLVRAYANVNGTAVLSSSDDNTVIPFTILKATALTAVKNTGKGLQIQWKAQKEAVKYKLQRKTAKGKWKTIQTTKETSFDDTTAKAGTKYFYTVIPYAKGSIKGNYNKTGLAGVRLDTPKLKKLVNNDNGLKLTWKAVKGATHYKVYRINSKGKLKLLAKTKTTGYVDKKVKNKTKYTYTVRAYSKAYAKCLSSYNKKGLSKTFTDPVLALAQKRLKKTGNTLKNAYKWAVSIPYKHQPAVYNMRGYANWSFKHKAGDCLGKASVFAMMAKELGYDCRLMYGYVPRRGGGMVDHGWVEIKYKGVTYICDPDFEYETRRNGYFIHYGQSGTWMYTDYKPLQ